MRGRQCLQQRDCGEEPGAIEQSARDRGRPNGDLRGLAPKGGGVLAMYRSNAIGYAAQR